MITFFKKLIQKMDPIIKIINTISTNRALEKKTVEQRFEDIFRENAWGGVGSVSGRGSDLDQTKTIIRELPILFEELTINSILDIPCGDFHWMKNINMINYKYIGGDIVKPIIEHNLINFETDNISFQHIDIIKDSLPQVDLVLVRDCLVHFSYNDIFLSLNNICCSRSKYLLTTTFPDKKHNNDIITGNWRPLNLILEPFHFPKPIKLINEKYSGENIAYVDKSLGLWRISDIANGLQNTSV